MALFEEYKNCLYESVRNRTVVIGLQRVDGLSVSDFLIQIARQEIDGKISTDEAQALIDVHYAQIHSNQSSYEFVPSDSEESKRLAQYNKTRRPGLSE